MRRRRPAYAWLALLVSDGDHDDRVCPRIARSVEDSERPPQPPLRLVADVGAHTVRAMAGRRTLASVAEPTEVARIERP